MTGKPIGPSLLRSSRPRPERSSQCGSLLRWFLRLRVHTREAKNGASALFQPPPPPSAPTAARIPRSLRYRHAWTNSTRNKKHAAEANFRATPAKESDRVWVYFENIVCRECRGCGGICVWHACAAEQSFSRLLLDELRMGQPARRCSPHAGEPASGRPGPQTASCRQ